MHKSIHPIAGHLYQSDTMPNQSEHIVIAVCTCKRPIMLEACIRSLFSQIVPGHLTLSILVVENDQEPRSRDLVSKLATSSSVIPLNYCLETQPGIPFARNRALEEALTMGSDWLAFIDDDEVADVNWISELHRTAKKYGAEVSKGHVIYSYPKECRWVDSYRSGSKSVKNEGTPLKNIATNNVIFSQFLFAPTGLGLRFDTSMRFTGGTDRDFFLLAYHAGVHMIFAPQAIVRETVPLSRCTLQYIFNRRARFSSNNVHIGYKHSPRDRIIKKYSRRKRKLFKRAIKYMLSSFIVFPTNRVQSLTFFLKGIDSLASAYGLWLALRGKRLHPYRKIHGF